MKRTGKTEVSKRHLIAENLKLWIRPVKYVEMLLPIMHIMVAFLVSHARHFFGGALLSSIHISVLEARPATLLSVLEARPATLLVN